MRLRLAELMRVAGCLVLSGMPGRSGRPRSRPRVPAPSRPSTPWRSIKHEARAPDVVGERLNSRDTAESFDGFPAV